MGKSLEQWVDENDAETLEHDLELHAECAAPEDFARMAMISIRQFVEARGIGDERGIIKESLDEASGCLKILDRVGRNPGVTAALKNIEKAKVELKKANTLSPRVKELEADLTAVFGEVQRYQPKGSPPSASYAMHTRWVLGEMMRKQELLRRAATKTVAQAGCLIWHGLSMSSLINALWEVLPIATCDGIYELPLDAELKSMIECIKAQYERDEAEGRTAAVAGPALIDHPERWL